MTDLFQSQAIADDWPTNYAQQFWDAWPAHFRKAEKKQVIAKLARIKREREVTWMAIYGGVTAYFASQPIPEFIPAPLVWLNKQRWQADYSRPADSRRGGFGDIAFGRE